MKKEENLGEYMDIKNIRKVYNKKVKVFGISNKEFSIFLGIFSFFIVFIMFINSLLYMMTINLSQFFIFISFVVFFIYIIITLKYSNKYLGEGVIFFLLKKYSFLGIFIVYIKTSLKKIHFINNKRYTKI